VLSCAGAYVYGAAGSNECPAGSVRIEAEAACRTAAAAAGKTAGLPFLWDNPYGPRGCNYRTSCNSVYFNPNLVGAGESGSQLLCAAVTTGAPALLTDARALAYIGACSGIARVCVSHVRIVRVLRLFGGAEASCRGEELGEGIVRRGSDGGAVRCGRRLCVYVRRVLDATARFGMDVHEVGLCIF
jgi:hypothetical protein